MKSREDIESLIEHYKDQLDDVEYEESKISNYTAPQQVRSIEFNKHSLKNVIKVLEFILQD